MLVSAHGEPRHYIGAARYAAVKTLGCVCTVTVNMFFADSSTMLKFS